MDEGGKLKLRGDAIFINDWMVAGDGVFAELRREIFQKTEAKYVNRFGIQLIRTQLVKIEGVEKVALCLGWWTMSNDIINPSLTAMEVKQKVQNLVKKGIKVQIWLNPEANTKLAELNKKLKTMANEKKIEIVETLARIGYILRRNGQPMIFKMRKNHPIPDRNLVGRFPKECGIRMQQDKYLCELKLRKPNVNTKK